MIFLDNASTTKIYPEALKAYNNFSIDNYYNASSVYGSGIGVSLELSKSRKNLINLLGGGIFDNLIFTSGATEANNLAINGVFRKNFKKMVFSIAEHPSVYNVAQDFKSLGVDVEFVNLKEDGTVDEADYTKKVKNADFVSVMHVNNETGAINDIKTLVSIAKSQCKNVIFHCDGVQAFGKTNVNVSNLGVDLYTISSHKIHGPKGVGALYVKKGIILKPLMIGGGQEFNLRSGTENTCGIVAFSKAAELSIRDLKQNFEYVTELKNAFVSNITSKFGAVINSPENGSPYIVSFSVPKVKAETILHMAESQGVLISNGSACSSKHTDNRILKAMGKDNEIVISSARVSFSFDTELKDVITASEIIKEKCRVYLKILK